MHYADNAIKYQIFFYFFFILNKTSFVSDDSISPRNSLISAGVIPHLTTRRRKATERTNTDFTPEALGSAPRDGSVQADHHEPFCWEEVKEEVGRWATLLVYSCLDQCSSN